ncbi:MAG: manganese efflux pump [Syntrophomonadaceae bacterium]|nr:manganese efflux pump [Syntrophomonadaceae bacterium]
MHENLITIILVAIVLGMDSFSLSLGMGLRGVTKRFEAKFVTIVALLHIIMPLIGLSLGLAIGEILGKWAAWIGAIILAYIGIDFLLKGYKEIKPATYTFKEGKKIFNASDKTIADDWWALILLGVSVSMDALTVGFSLGALKMPITITVLIMGFVAGIMTLLGFVGGRIFSRVVGSYAQIIGGVILLALALKLVL